MITLSPGCAIPGWRAGYSDRDDPQQCAPVVVNPTPVTVILTKIWSGVKLTWNSVAGKIYRVSYTNALTGAWGDLSANITATGTTTTWTDTSALPNQRYYRVYSIN